MDEAFFINYTRLNKKLIQKNRKELRCSSYTVELGSEEFFDTNLSNAFTEKNSLFPKRERSCRQNEFFKQSTA